MQKWYTPDDVAELLQVSRSTAYKIVKQYIEAGGTHWQPTKRLTRVEPNEFKKYLERQ